MLGSRCGCRPRRGPDQIKDGPGGYIGAGGDEPVEFFHLPWPSDRERTVIETVRPPRRQRWKVVGFKCGDRVGPLESAEVFGRFSLLHTGHMGGGRRHRSALQGTVAAKSWLAGVRQPQNEGGRGVI